MKKIKVFKVNQKWVRKLIGRLKWITLPLMNADEIWFITDNTEQITDINDPDFWKTIDSTNA